MNRTTQFLAGPLSEERYRKNLPYFLSNLELETFNKALKAKPASWKYRNKEITYNLNSDYYRTEEWNNINWKDSIVVFGCSHVFGEGLANDETFCYHLQQLTSRQVVNMGSSGTGPQFSWHNSLIMDNLYGAPYAVIQVWSCYSRLPYYSEDSIKRIGPWSGSSWDNYDKDAKDLYNLWNKSEINAMTQFYFTALSSNNYWKNRCKYIEATFFKHVASLLKINHYEKLDNARDDVHCGEITNIAVAKDLQKKLEY